MTNAKRKAKEARLQEVTDLLAIKEEAREVIFSDIHRLFIEQCRLEKELRR